jgi:predicted transcriptional regulator
MWGMVKMSVYLDDEQMARLDETAEVSGRSQADLIREGVDQVIQRYLREPPRMNARASSRSLGRLGEELLDDVGSGLLDLL